MVSTSLPELLPDPQLSKRAYLPQFARLQRAGIFFAKTARFLQMQFGDNGDVMRRLKPALPCSFTAKPPRPRPLCRYYHILSSIIRCTYTIWIIIDVCTYIIWIIDTVFTSSFWFAFLPHVGFTRVLQFSEFLLLPTKLQTLAVTYILCSGQVMILLKWMCDCKETIASILILNDNWWLKLAIVADQLIIIASARVR